MQETQPYPPTQAQPAAVQTEAEKQEAYTAVQGASPHDEPNWPGTGVAPVQDDEDAEEAPKQWILWVYAGITLFMLVSLGCSAAGVAGLNEYVEQNLYSDYGSVKYILALCIISILVIAYGIAYEQKVAVVHKYTKLRFELQLAVGTILITIMWFAAAVAHAAWVGKGRYCDDGGSCQFLTPKGRALYGALAFFAFAEWILWIPIAARAGVVTWRKYRLSRDRQVERQVRAGRVV